MQSIIEEFKYSTDLLYYTLSDQKSILSKIKKRELISLTLFFYQLPKEQYNTILLLLIFYNKN